MDPVWICCWAGHVTPNGGYFFDDVNIITNVIHLRLWSINNRGGNGWVFVLVIRLKICCNYTDILSTFVIARIAHFFIKELEKDATFYFRDYTTPFFDIDDDYHQTVPITMYILLGTLKISSKLTVHSPNFIYKKVHRAYQTDGNDLQYIFHSQKNYIAK